MIIDRFIAIGQAAESAFTNVFAPLFFVLLVLGFTGKRITIQISKTEHAIAYSGILLSLSLYGYGLWSGASPYEALLPAAETVKNTAYAVAFSLMLFNVSHLVRTPVHFKHH